VVLPPCAALQPVMTRDKLLSMERMPTWIVGMERPVKASASWQGGAGRRVASPPPAQRTFQRGRGGWPRMKTQAGTSRLVRP
jgi:hypothetical protein